MAIDSKKDAILKLLELSEFYITEYTDSELLFDFDFLNFYKLCKNNYPDLIDEEFKSYFGELYNRAERHCISLNKTVEISEEVPEEVCSVIKTIAKFKYLIRYKQTEKKHCVSYLVDGEGFLAPLTKDSFDYLYNSEFFSKMKWRKNITDLII